MEIQEVEIEKTVTVKGRAYLFTPEEEVWLSALAGCTVRWSDLPGDMADFYALLCMNAGMNAPDSLTREAQNTVKDAAEKRWGRK